MFAKHRIPTITRLFAAALIFALGANGSLPAQESSKPERKENLILGTLDELAVGQSPLAAPSIQALGPGLSTIGLDFQMSQLSGDTSFIPPDTMGDVGPDHIVEMINGVYEVYDKQDGTVLESRSLDGFWTNVVGLNVPQNICQADNTCSIDGAACAVTSDCNANFTFDPRIVYDRLSQRWIAISIDGALGGDNDFYLARSDTSDPTGNWEGLKFDSDTLGPQEFHDYETLAVDADAVTSCTQDFDSGNGGGGVESCYTVPKADLLAAVPSVANMTRFESNPPNLPSVSGSIQPALSYGAAADGITPILGVNSGFIVRGDITGAGAAGAVLAATGGIAGDPGHANPPAARQPAADPGATIENVAPRFVSNVVEIGDSIWAVHSVAGTGGNAALQWYEIEESTDTMLQFGLIEDVTEDYHEPSIAVNSMGDVVIGYSCSGPMLNVSTCISVGETIGGITSFEPRQIVTPGAGIYFQLVRGRNRWGDYSATVVDPDDECTFWTMQEFVAVGGPSNVGPGGMGTDDDVEGGLYGTQVTEVVINGCAESDIQLVKADNPDPVVAGTNLSYTLDVSNLGPTRAFSVVASDFLPADVSFVSSFDGDWSCAHAAGTVDCTWNGGNPMGSLASGEDADTINLTVAVNPSMVFEGRFSLSNTADAASDTPDPDTTNNEDSEGTSVVAETDLDIERFEAVDPPEEILVAEDVAITLEKDVSNHGPSWPVNTEITVDATPPADSTVDPAMASQDVLIPELDTVVTVEEHFTINCGAASHHTWSFENTIVPTDPMTTDPDPSNNTATLDLEIECVVPVAINFKPGSDPNSEQRLKGTATVALLTTEAGEYGTPLDFDATLVDPLSLRFGPPGIFGDDGLGAFETHNRGHLEDSIELDEVTMDGDTDLVLHFRMQEAGFDGTETEACLKGEFTDDTGTHQFFGCDTVRFPPGSD